MVIFDFIEAYNGNMTLKLLVALNWVAQAYDTEVILKIDDDTMLNTARAFYLMNRTLHQRDRSGQLKKFTMGSCMLETWPFRNKGHKWYISEEMYPLEMYPRYHNGPLMGFSRRAIPVLLENSHKIPLVTIDDVSISILASFTHGQVPMMCPPYWTANNCHNLKYCRLCTSVHLANSDPLFYMDIWEKYSANTTNYLSFMWWFT